MALHGNEAVSLSTQELPEKHPRCHRKHPIPLKYEGKRGSTRKKTHTPKKQLIGGKKKNMEETPTKTGTFLISASVALEETPKIA